MKSRLIYFLPDELAKRQPIVLIDGECNHCNQSVRFLLKNNRRKDLNFTSLQSESGKMIVAIAGKLFHNSDSVLFLNNNTLSGKSAAVFHIVTHLGFAWQIVKIFMIIPLFVRDSIYRFIANNRYNWFGGKTSCMLTNEYPERFIN